MHVTAHAKAGQAMLRFPPNPTLTVAQMQDLAKGLNEVAARAARMQPGDPYERAVIELGSPSEAPKGPGDPAPR